MDRNVDALDWTLLQSFSAVVEAGSLSGAARKLGQSQPTIGRHVKQLELVLGVDLFTRAPRGLVPTVAGLEIADMTRDMQSAATRLRRIADGKAGDLNGTVRITASVVTSHFILPRIIADMRQVMPEIQIDLVPSDTTENLIFREADIAVRMYRPTQLDVISKHICDQPMAVYAAKSYLDRIGRPETLEDAARLDFVGFDKSDVIIRVLNDFGLTATRDFFAVRCDQQAVHWELIRAGCGLGGAQTIIGDADPTMERILEGQLQLQALPIWLTAPQALRTNPRIRAVWDYLSEALVQQIDA
ncbi:LysR family transcriptional regulator [Boseongicola aestuarii]|uniref:HTH-type transcriptional activator CmpR n=1 Tax=Boseongicola aestuarii TaxID=1470561 RepID=A0A238J4D9_9RHOB|nr:LysR family transcriptional regulator [Boseongicola aestuarii]SMX25526.1 HTH-type transcriptional activator CmpR [Boseongicola aestuarii]